jgi:uncharacterized protein YjaZ
MKRVLISTALVLAFITLVFTQTVQMAQTAHAFKEQQQPIVRAQQNQIDELKQLVTGARSIVTESVSAQTYNRLSEKTVKPIRGKKLVLTGVVRDGEEVLFRF